MFATNRRTEFSLHFRSATTADISEIAAILTGYAKFTKNSGMDNWWPVPFPKDQIATSISLKETHVVEREDRLVATFRLIWTDPTFWGQQPPVAGYLHKFAVKRAFRHQKIGQRTLDSISNYVGQRGRYYVRLDCQATNRFIIRYYESLSFRKIRFVNI